MLTGNIAVVDTEVSGAQRNKGNPFDPRNKLVTCGTLQGGNYLNHVVERGHDPYGDAIQSIRSVVERCEWFVAFNAKFDLHWLRRYGIILRQEQRIWDCQLAHFLITSQQRRYPSLNDALLRYGIDTKLDVVSTEYWAKGLDTDEVPLPILLEYQEDDVRKTWEVAQRQYDELESKGLLKLMDLCCKDLKVLEEMEWNGLLLDVDYAAEASKDLRDEQEGLKGKLSEIYEHLPINWSSPQQVSAALFGGSIDVSRTEQIGCFKTGPRTGLPKYKKVVERIQLEPLVKPLEGSELEKDGVWATDKAALKQLRPKGKAKEVIETYLAYKEIDKLVGTYYDGLRQKLVDYKWEDYTIHHQLNQCVVVTGRLSSSAPNLQNVHKKVKRIFVSRYGNTDLAR